MWTWQESYISKFIGLILLFLFLDETQNWPLVINISDESKILGDVISGFCTLLAGAMAVFAAWFTVHETRKQARAEIDGIRYASKQRCKKKLQALLLLIESNGSNETFSKNEATNSDLSSMYRYQENYIKLFKSIDRDIFEEFDLGHRYDTAVLIFDLWNDIYSLWKSRSPILKDIADVLLIESAGQRRSQMISFVKNFIDSLDNKKVEWLL